MKSLFDRIMCVCSLTISLTVQAETGHYVGGIEGIKAATIPPPGQYYLAYNVFYNADKLMDEHGTDTGTGFDASIYALVNRFVWVTDKKIWGGDLGFDVVVPFTNTNIEIRSLGVEDDQFGLGDLFAQSFLAWHGSNYDTVAAIALYMPTGDYSANEPASPGKDFWTTMLSLGGTYYFDIDKAWSFSVLSRYEIHSKKDSADITPGNDFQFEWGLGKSITPTFDLGLTGYAHWQVSDDRGSDVTWNKSTHDRVFAIGPEAKLFIPSISTFVSLRAHWEFDAKDRPEGNLVTLTFTKVF